MLSQEEFDRLTAQSEATLTAKVICDSVNPDGCRLTTMEWTYPRFIHAEIMTHRKLSRNSASSRAIPMAKMLERIQTNPVFPLHWGKAQKGMQAEEELSPGNKLAAGHEWMEAMRDAVDHATMLQDLGIHKQLGNRLTEPWMWITVVVSATNFENLFALRCHKDAEPHFQNLAYKVRAAYDASLPDAVGWGAWHLPYFGIHKDDDNIPSEDRPKISAARCGRVSYLTQAGIRDPEEDLKLYARLAAGKPLHASPLEHPAAAISEGFQPDGDIEDWGNFDPGWLQFRKCHDGECITARELAA